ncbi:MAG: helix-turn-helix domain-containing protein [Actinomycetota bacterium]|nr:helix-turn-helix domain-containing protein [Actinomycetota bacterium]
MGWTERTLHRRCQDASGYGPAVLRRILRFHLALRVARQGASFAVTAARAGYADQAHLAREVRALPDCRWVSWSQASVHASPTHGARQPDTPASGVNRSTGRPSGSCTTA